MFTARSIDNMAGGVERMVIHIMNDLVKHDVNGILIERGKGSTSLAKTIDYMITNHYKRESLANSDMRMYQAYVSKF